MFSYYTVWEVRETGSQDNGGGFVTGASGTDYSQQDAAQYALNPVTSAGAGAIMLHASAAADMVGNICRVVSGANATAGWYEITSVVAGVSITVDRNWCTGVVPNGVVNIGGAFKIGGLLDDEFGEAKLAANIVWIKKGTYTLGESFALSTVGTWADPLTWIGYKSTRNDECIGDDRPLFVCGPNQFSFGGYTVVKNIRVTTARSSGFSLGTNNLVVNCKSQQTGAAGQPAFYLTGGTRAIKCEAISTGDGFFMLDSICTCCFAHDCVTGYDLSSGSNNRSEVMLSVADNCDVGFLLGDRPANMLLNNTIYSCTTGVSGTTSSSNFFINNIIAECTTGASWTNNARSNVWDYNCWSDNTTDVTNVTKGPNDVTDDARLKDPANDDFTLKGGSPCFGAGLSLGSDVGLA